jgi:hypothetical protein
MLNDDAADSELTQDSFCRGGGGGSAPFSIPANLGGLWWQIRWQSTLVAPNPVAECLILLVLCCDSHRLLQPIGARPASHARWLMLPGG